MHRIVKGEKGRGNVISPVYSPLQIPLTGPVVDSSIVKVNKFVKDAIRNVVKEFHSKKEYLSIHTLKKKLESNYD